MMGDSSRKRKKAPISEEDISNVIQRYSPEAVLALMNEVWELGVAKIDWVSLVKKTKTGITSPREYQMVWRHIAYGHALLDQNKIHTHADIPLDDDSDLEIERECFPPVSREASAEAAAYVKVLMASGCSNDPDLPSNSTIEAPLTINIPNIKSKSAASDSSLHACAIQGTNITIPVFVQKQPQASAMTIGEKKPISEPSGVNLPPKKKRKGWSAGEDKKLTAAVEKYGEQNWDKISIGDFKDDRKAPELSQRWTFLKKKQGNSNVTQHPDLQNSAAFQANQAVTRFIDGDFVKTPHLSGVGMKLPLQTQKALTLPQERPKPQVPTDRPLLTTTTTPDPRVKAVAISVGARVASSADAALFMEAAHSQNVVHIKSGGGAIKKAPATIIKSQLPTNVHFIRDGLTKAPLSATLAAKPNMVQGHPVKPAVPVVMPPDGFTKAPLSATPAAKPNVVQGHQIKPAVTAVMPPNSASTTSSVKTANGPVPVKPPVQIAHKADNADRKDQ